MDISSRFSLVDFLAYLFPGTVGALGIYLLLLLTPLRDALNAIPKDLATGILFLGLSYILGVILSGFSEMVLRERQYRGGGGAKDKIHLPGFERDVVDAFQAMFSGDQLDKQEWSITHYYLCRALVTEYMPNATQVIQRQSSLRQLRMNMVLPILLWMGVGLGWGVWGITYNVPEWGIGLMVASVVLTLITLGTIYNRMNANDVREVRETLAAFVAGYKAGAFDRTKAGLTHYELTGDVLYSCHACSIAR